MTPICLMPSKALGSRGKRWRPPATIVSSRSAILTTRVSNTFEVKLIAGLSICARIDWISWPGAKGRQDGLARRWTRRQYARDGMLEHGHRRLGNVLRANARHG